ncbi:GspH/FimT family pseudopilin [Thiorhodococcus fuscus]|uniref:Type II secretion system protein H n=1 Tax=Thiorhodococcus fuscus TaxID=527200 RepID=A0ABW4Y5K4_9GAMM
MKPDRPTEPRRPRPDTSGFTLLELLVTFAVIAILLTVALPSMRAMLQRNHLKAAAQSIAEDLQWTRSESIKRNRELQVRFDSDRETWCYGIGETENTACDCQPTAAPSDACALKRVSGADYPNVTLAATFNTTQFKPRRATAINGSITVTAETGASLRVILSRLGRIRICAPDSSVLGYDPCSD